MASCRSATQSLNRMRRSRRHVGRAALRFAQELAHACAGAFGKTVAGVVLHGSLTLDDYVPGRSDIDLLVVIDDPASDARLAALAEAMASRRAEAPGPADLRLVTRQVAASPTPAPPLEAYLRSPPAPGSGRRAPAPRGARPGGGALGVPRARPQPAGAAPAELLGEIPTGGWWPPATRSWPPGRRSGTTRRTPS